MCVKCKSPLHSLRKQRSSQLQCVLGRQTGKVLWLALPPEQCSKASPHSNRVYCSILFGSQMFAFPTREVWANCSHELIKCVLRHVDLRTINKPPDTARLQNQSFSQNGTSGEIPKSPQTIYNRSTRCLLREPSYLAPHTLLAGVDM